MRRLTLAFALLCFITAVIVAGYAYYTLVRVPDAEMGILDFISKVVSKILRTLIGA